MNWLSQKSNVSIATLRGRSDSVNRNRESQAPPPRTMRISEPIPRRPNTATSYFQPSQRPSTAGALGRHQSSSPLSGSPGRTQLPPIPQSPNTPLSLRSSRSSPSLNSPISSPSSQTFNTSSYTPSLSQAMPSSQIQDGFMTTKVMAPITPMMTPIAQSAVPLPAASTPTSSRTRLSINTTASVPPQPPFEPVLVSPWATCSIPSTMNPSQFIISLETATTTHRTSLATLTSRPSFLADYLNNLKDKDEEAEEEKDDDAASTSSSSAVPSPFTRAFSAHLTSQGLHESQTSSSRVHLFLDRPSAPYPYILSYLRSPTSHPGSLPRGAQLRSQSSNAEKLDALCELRDEAVYLGLRELGELCEAELKRFYGLRIAGHARSESDGYHPHPPPPQQPLSPITSSRLQGRRSTEHLRKLAMASRTGPSAVAAVPESVHETDGDAESPAELGKAMSIGMLPWQGTELGIRTSLRASVGSSNSSDGAGPDVSSTTVPNKPVLDAYHHNDELIRRLGSQDSNRASSAATVVVGPALANRSRSNSHTGYGGRTGSVVVPPSTIATSMVGRGSFLPTMTSPITPQHVVSSSGNWF
ncbi:hypothetical protein FRB97_007522 [Tulasnella sp. 331]|nr:hypothetical protein FRB97_007522 [Tulasnella sp. 331]